MRAMIAIALVSSVARAEPIALELAGYGLREVRFDLDGGLTYAPLDKRGKPGKRERVALPEKLLAPIRKAIAEAKLDALPPPQPAPPLFGMRKLSEVYHVTLVHPDRRMSYAFDARDGDRSPLLPIALAVRDAVDWLDTPPVRLAVGRFEVGVQDGRVGVGVDEWSLYAPLEGADVERLRPFAGRRIKLEVARERDRPGVFVLRRILQKLQ